MLWRKAFQGSPRAAPKRLCASSSIRLLTDCLKPMPLSSLQDGYMALQRHRSCLHHDTTLILLAVGSLDPLNPSSSGVGAHITSCVLRVETGQLLRPQPGSNRWSLCKNTDCTLVQPVMYSNPLKLNYSKRKQWEKRGGKNLKKNQTSNISHVGLSAISKQLDMLCVTPPCIDLLENVFILNERGNRSDAG